MEIWLEARSSRKQNSLCEGNTKMDLEGKHEFKWTDWLFFSGDDDYLGFDNTGGLLFNRL
jgi:hypothetical protein